MFEGHRGLFFALRPLALICLRPSGPFGSVSFCSCVLSSPRSPFGLVSSWLFVFSGPRGLFGFVSSSFYEVWGLPGPYRFVSSWLLGVLGVRLGLFLPVSAYFWFMGSVRVCFFQFLHDFGPYGSVWVCRFRFFLPAQPVFDKCGVTD